MGKGKSRYGENERALLRSTLFLSPGIKPGINHICQTTRLQIGLALPTGH